MPPINKTFDEFTDALEAREVKILNLVGTGTVLLAVVLVDFLAAPPDQEHIEVWKVA